MNLKQNPLQKWTTGGLLMSMLILGCNADGFIFGPSRPASPPQEPMTAQPVDTPAQPPAEPTRDDASTTIAQDPDAPTDSLHKRIQQYVGRFPSDDLARKATGRTVQSAAASPAMHQEPAQKPSATFDQQQATPLTIAQQEDAPTPTEAVAAPRVDDSTTQLTIPPRTTPQFGQTVQPSTPVKPDQHTVQITQIKPAPMPPATTAEKQTITAANLPTTKQIRTGKSAAVTTIPTGNLQQTIENLEQTIKNRPLEWDEQFRLRLLYLANGETDKATGPIEGVDPVQADLLAAIFRTAATAQQAMHQPGGADATASNMQALGAIDELRRLIGQQSGVVIPRMALVTRVTSFGDYEEIAPLRFQAGQPIEAFVYTEVANFHTEPTDDGKVRTALSAKVEVFNADGKSVWHRTEPRIEDRTRSPRRDFFIPFPVKLPANIPPGNYVLKVTIEDTIGATADQQRLTFTVAHK